MKTKAKSKFKPKTLREQFPRTNCDCEKCVTCCRHMPGVLAPGDLDRIANHSNSHNLEFLLEHFQASEGAKALRRTPQGPELIQIRSIVPRLTETGCVFLTAEGRCSIHAVAPFGCAALDMHMGDEAGQDRVNALGRAQIAEWVEDGAYAQTWRTLARHGKVATPLVERRERLAAAISEIEKAEHDRKGQ